MLSFDPERSIARARRILPDGGWDSLDVAQRELVALAAAGMVVADGPATSDERGALEQLSLFLRLPPHPADLAARFESARLLSDLAAHARDGSFARHLFVATYLVGMGDGVLMDSERVFLDECSRALSMDPALCVELERELHGILYEEVLDTCWKDGAVSPKERRILNASAKLLGLDESTAHVIEAAYAERVTRGGMGAY